MVLHICLQRRENKLISRHAPTQPGRGAAAKPHSPRCLLQPARWTPAAVSVPGRAGPYIALPRGGKSGLSSAAARPGPTCLSMTRSAAADSPRGAGGRHRPALTHRGRRAREGSGGVERRRRGRTAAIPRPAPTRPPARRGLAWPGLAPFPRREHLPPAPRAARATGETPGAPSAPERAAIDPHAPPATPARCPARGGRSAGTAGPRPDPLSRPQRAAHAARRHVGARSAPWARRPRGAAPGRERRPPPAAHRQRHRPGRGCRGARLGPSSASGHQLHFSGRPCLPRWFYFQR